MIKILQPDMPSVDELIHYLKRIDESKVYVNNGYLVQELQSRLEAMTGAHVAIVSNGTVALELALKAFEYHPNDAIIPALTFSATGLAAKNSNSELKITLADVDKNTWQLTPESAQNVSYHNADSFYQHTVAMPVATFGMPVDIKQWENYPIPVVIDAAGAFPHQKVSSDPNITTCFSLHATKFVGCGEGGFVASANEELIERVRSMAAFGEDGTNAKMSEYHAAVALASLDSISDKMVKLAWVREWYEKHGEGLDLRFSSTILNVLLPVPASPLIPKLMDEGIETKQWYRPYLDERPEFAVPRGAFPVTDHLRDHLLGLPFHAFLTEQDVVHVCETLKRRLG